MAITVGWPSDDHTNEDSGEAPAQPVSLNALDVGGIVTAQGGGDYQILIDTPSGAFATAKVSIEGHPAADLDGDRNYSDRIAVKNVFAYVSLDPRGDLQIRRAVIDIAKCNGCHDSAGAGVSLHGNNRTAELQVCGVCHNPDATDINRRPADPSLAADGKREESIDIKRMIHQIHAGRELQNGIVLYGFGNIEHDFSQVGFTGNLKNCETCHLPGTYGAEDAWQTLPSTIDTGADRDDRSDDLNVSSTAAVCSSCHDDNVAKDHMLLFDASFRALDAEIQ
jgi:OmcA/MtrC family decaheme c-type cytochrome